MTGNRFVVRDHALALWLTIRPVVGLAAATAGLFAVMWLGGSIAIHYGFPADHPISAGATLSLVVVPLIWVVIFAAREVYPEKLAVVRRGRK